MGDDVGVTREELEDRACEITEMAHETLMDLGFSQHEACYELLLAAEALLPAGDCSTCFLQEVFVLERRHDPGCQEANREDV